MKNNSKLAKSNKTQKTQKTKRILSKKNSKVTMYGGNSHDEVTGGNLSQGFPEGYSGLPVTEKAEYWGDTKKQTDTPKASSSTGTITQPVQEDDISKSQLTPPPPRKTLSLIPDTSIETREATWEHIDASGSDLPVAEVLPVTTPTGHENWEKVKITTDDDTNKRVLTPPITQEDPPKTPISGTITNVTKVQEDKDKQTVHGRWGKVNESIKTGTFAKKTITNGDGKEELDIIISKLAGFGELKPEKQEEYKNTISKYRDNIHDCQALETAYKTKHDEIKELNELFMELAKSIKSKINIDRTLIDYLTQVWTDLEANGTQINDLDSYITEQNQWQDDLGDTIKEIDRLITHVKKTENNEERMEGAKKISLLNPSNTVDQNELQTILDRPIADKPVITRKDETMRDDPYTILEVNRGDTLDTIKKAYKRLALRWHPDKKNGNEEMFKRITVAYDALNPDKKGGTRKKRKLSLVEAEQIFKNVFGIHPGSI